MESDTLPEKICFVADQSENIFTEYDSGAAQIEENQARIHDFSKVVTPDHVLVVKDIRIPPVASSNPVPPSARAGLEIASIKVGESSRSCVGVS